MIYHLLGEKNVKDGRPAFCEEGTELGSFFVVKRGEAWGGLFRDIVTRASVAHSWVAE